MDNPAHPRPRDYALAVLFHLDDWRVTTDHFVIAPGISLHRLEGTAVEQLYLRLCDSGHDDGEPFYFRSFLQVDARNQDDYLLDYGDPYSLVDRFCNLIAVRQQHPLDLVRIIRSSDRFLTSDSTQILYAPGGQTEFLLRIDAVLDDDTVSDIATAWRTLDPLWRKSRSAGRVCNALTYFYYSWRSPYLDQVCLHLMIALECLFAPHHAGESTHQIAFSVAQFMGGKPDEIERRFDFIRKLYSVRSAVVHGGHADEDKLVELVPEAFVLVAKLLLRILITPGTAREFDEESKRRQLLRSLLFHA
jgi:hypothetical protein